MAAWAETPWDPGGSALQLFTSTHSYLDQTLAGFYGVSGPSGDAFVRANLDATKRSGVVTMAALLAVNAKSDRSSPIRRGLFVRERLFCRVMPQAPDSVTTEIPVDKTKTLREQMAQHRDDPSCSGCHRIMDPVGLGLENFDGIGKWRDTENGRVVDASGEIVGTTDANGAFVGGVQLAQRLGASEEVRSCMVTQWFRFAHGRAETPADRCSLEYLEGAAAKANYNVPELLVALTQTDAFRSIIAVAPSP